MEADCAKLDHLLCIGNNTFLEQSNYRDTNQETIAYYNFENELGLDVSWEGKYNFAYD